MANVNIKFNGKDFLLSCEDGQEDHLEELSSNLNEKFESLKSKLGNLGENKLLLITSISLMDEYFETKKKIEELEKGKKKDQQKQNDFNQKIDELNQETEYLIEEIDKWQM